MCIRDRIQCEASPTRAIRPQETATETSSIISWVQTLINLVWVRTRSAGTLPPATAARVPLTSQSGLLQKVLIIEFPPVQSDLDKMCIRDSWWSRTQISPLKMRTEHTFWKQALSSRMAAQRICCMIPRFARHIWDADYIIKRKR